ncbi:DUF4391 domain-containing protein [Desulfotignum phosphitoxidans]|uniref:DUF4391 domain-containing protein n=1 Tax=Desulfotignum phosphitoxidans TaxID=190898 RepID=UPI001F258CEA|nr:DUF4391 domain-containing protein [Desulfotignum phosphitoxidans]
MANNRYDKPLFRNTGPQITLAISIAPKRFSQAEQGAFVVERFFTTDWMDIAHLKEPEAAFNRQVQLNTEIKRKESELKQLVKTGV